MQGGKGKKEGKRGEGSAENPCVSSNIPENSLRSYLKISGA